MAMYENRKKSARSIEVYLDRTMTLSVHIQYTIIVTRVLDK